MKIQPTGGLAAVNMLCLSLRLRVGGELLCRRLGLLLLFFLDYSCRRLVVHNCYWSNFQLTLQRQWLGEAIAINVSPHACLIKYFVSLEMSFSFLVM